MTTIVFCVAPKNPKRDSASLETRVFVALLKAADRLSQQAEDLMKQHGLTGTQYNVLRILRGAEPSGLPCKGISNRMISHDPDMTRLRDRLVTLTPQQVRVLMMLSEGLLNKQIAYELGVSEATIKAHVSAILQKLGVESRTQAVIAAAKIAGGQWRQGTPTG